MKKVVTITSEKTYDVLIGVSWLPQLQSEISSYKKVLIVLPASLDKSLKITEEIKNALGSDQSKVSFYFTPDGEAQKTSAILLEILDSAGSHNLSRSDLIVAIGGGATSDVAGFAAACWLRGIAWIAVPTTLAAMVDASLGGKTGINTSHGKNLIGTFHSPSAVIVDTFFLQSLPARDLSAGLAEVAKCGFIADPHILTILKGNYLSSLEELILRSVQVKADVVSQDFTESFHREILNYGHSLGHAIEQRSNYSLRHGEAISIGLIFAAELSHAHGSLSASDLALHREILTKLSLPTTYEKSAWNELFEILTRDKKNRGGEIRFVSLKSIGKPDRITGISKEQLAAVYEKVTS